MSETKLTVGVRNLLTAVRDGVSYRGVATSYEAALSAGWLVWEDTYKRCGPDGDWGRGYVLTETGREVLTAAIRRATRHAGNCRCPKCLREHVGNCRRINCPVCG
jgi:hypothetical protein